MLTNNRSMKRAIAALCVATLACSAVGCGEEKKEAIPTFSNATYIAQMATLKCYYHNTAKLSHEGSWFFNNGYKRMWMEYSGIVKYGIDADKVTISPDANGHRVIITVPPAHVLDDPDVNEKSFSKPLVSTGFATSITAEEKTEMFDKAQQSMLKQAKTDSALLAQAEARARTILEQYVRNVLGDDAKNWTIEFKDVQTNRHELRSIEVLLQFRTRARSQTRPEQPTRLRRAMHRMDQRPDMPQTLRSGHQGDAALHATLSRR